MRELASRQGSYVSASGDETFDSLSDFNPLIACAPWLFWDCFVELDGQVFLAIAEAGAFLALASGVIDKIADGQAHPPAEFSILHQVLCNQAFAGFRVAFQRGSTFWGHYDRLSRIYWQSLEQELAYQRDPSSLDTELHRRVAGGKVSPMAATLAGLAIASDQPRLIQPIEDSLRWTFVAGQIHDDILDWAEDWTTGHITLFLKRLAEPMEVDRLSWPSVGELRVRLEETWLDVEQYSEVLRYYGEAQGAVAGMNCPTWSDYLAVYRDRAVRDQRLAAARRLRHVFSEAPAGTLNP